MKGWLAAGLVAALCLGTLVPLILRAGSAGLAPGDFAAIRFTVLQAALSALVTVVLAAPVAGALARRDFPGRGLFIGLLGAPFILPVIVAVLGLVALFGRGGLINAGLGALGLPSVSIYGLPGVILAHVWLNLPFAVRLILAAWEAVPAERFRLAATLGLPVWRYLALPLWREVLPGAFALVFLVCLTSFVVALTLGGGPAATTLELAIWQALRFDFDPGKAALLALVQVAIGAVAAALAATVQVPFRIGAGRGRVVRRFDGQGWGARLRDGVVLAAVALALVLPMALVLTRGVLALGLVPDAVWGAALRSGIVALGSAALALGLAMMLAPAGRGAAGIALVLPLASSGLVLATGLYLFLLPVLRPADLVWPVAITVNAVLALPFGLQVLRPAWQRAEAGTGRLADALGLTGWARFRIGILPGIRPQMGLTAGLAAALAMGDIGVMGLFAAPDAPTLPILVQQLMGAYRMEAAMAVAVLLTAQSLLLFLICDTWGRRDAGV